MIASLHSFVYKQNFMSSTNLPLHTEFSAGLWLVLDLVLCRSTSLRTRSTRRRPLTTTRRRTEKRPLPKTWATTSTSWLHRSVLFPSPPNPNPSPSPKTWATSTSWLHRSVHPPFPKDVCHTSIFWLHRSVPPTKLGTSVPTHPIRFNHVTDCTLLGVLLFVSAYKYLNTLAKDGLLCCVTSICFHATSNPYSIW